jgi:hypothetical protein
MERIMSHKGMKPDVLARSVYKHVIADLATLHSIDPETRTVTLRHIDDAKITRKPFDLDRMFFIRRRIVDSGGLGTSAREVMEQVGGEWSVNWIGEEQ